MPSGAKVLPKDPSTWKRTKGGYELFYTGYKPTNPNSDYSRQGATRENWFPSHRKAQLDENYLARMGLTAGRMKDEYALFFGQLILPMCDPKRSGIVNDTRMGYYVPVAKYPTAMPPM